MFLCLLHLLLDQAVFQLLRAERRQSLGFWGEKCADVFDQAAKGIVLPARTIYGRRSWCDVVLGQLGWRIDLAAYNALGAAAWGHEPNNERGSQDTTTDSVA